MDHMFRPHPSSGRNNGLAGRQTVGKSLAANFFACSQDRRPAGTMNRPVDSAAAHQRAVGRIDDGIDSFLGDIAHFDDHTAIEKSSESIHNPAKIIF